MAFERLLRLTKKCPGYVVSGLRNASVGIATVTQELFESQYYVTRAHFGARSLFCHDSGTSAGWLEWKNGDGLETVCKVLQQKLFFVGMNK